MELPVSRAGVCGSLLARNAAFVSAGGMSGSKHFPLWQMGSDFPPLDVRF